MLFRPADTNCDKDSEVLSHYSLVHNSQAAVMLIDWLVDISSADQQSRVSKSICGLCTSVSWNAMQCSKAGMIASIVRCLQQSSSLSLDTSVVGEF